MKDKDLDYIKTKNPNAGFNPRPKHLRKLGGGPVKISKPKNFEKALQRLKDTGKLSMDDFNSAADIGAFLDYYNNTIVKKSEKYANNEILEISKLLARIQGRSSTIIKKDDII